MAWKAGTHYSKLVFAVLVVLNSAWILYVYLSLTHLGTFGPAKLSGALEGTIERPYVYRVLVPFLAKVLSPFVSSSLTEKLSSAPLPIKIAFEALSDGGYAREASAIFVIMFCSLIGLAYAQKKFIKQLGMQSNEQVILPLLTQLCILPLSIFFAYYYDLPQVFLITLGLGFLQECDWKNYLITLALASLNKETSVVLILVFLIYYLPRLPRKTFVLLLISQTVIYAIIRFGLIYVYRNNPGATVYFTLKNHYEQYLGYPPSLIFTLIFFLVFGFLILRDWKRKHAFLRASSVMIVFILILFFTSGMPVEFRVFLDALPIIVLLIYPPSDSLATSG